MTSIDVARIAILFDRIVWEDLTFMEQKIAEILIDGGYLRKEKSANFGHYVLRTV